MSVKDAGVGNRASRQVLFEGWFEGSLVFRVSVRGFGHLGRCTSRGWGSAILFLSHLRGYTHPRKAVT